MTTETPEKGPARAVVGASPALAPGPCAPGAVVYSPAPYGPFFGVGDIAPYRFPPAQ